MAYSFKQIEAHDPSNPGLVAPNAMVTIFEPGDPAMTPLTLTTLTGQALANPVKVNGLGYGPAFMHATLSQVAWAGGGLTGTFESYEGMRDEAIAARDAANTAAANAAAEAQAAIGDATVAAEAAAAAADASALEAANAAALVGAPADSAIATAINASGSATKAALSATTAQALGKLGAGGLDIWDAYTAGTTLPDSSYSAWIGGIDAALGNTATKTTVGTGSDGQSIYTYTAGRVGAPEVLLSSGVHGHERNNKHAAFRFFEQFAKATDSSMRELQQRVRIVWCPALNPSGWNATRHNSNGVDLNRNAAYFWDRHIVPQSEIDLGRGTKGTAAMSEPETLALKNIIDTTRVSAFLDCHMWNNTGAHIKTYSAGSAALGNRRLVNSFLERWGREYNAAGTLTVDPPQTNFDPMLNSWAQHYIYRTKGRQSAASVIFEIRDDLLGCTLTSTPKPAMRVYCGLIHAYILEWLESGQVSLPLVPEDWYAFRTQDQSDEAADLTAGGNMLTSAANTPFQFNVTGASGTRSRRVKWLDIPIKTNGTLYVRTTTVFRNLSGTTTEQLVTHFVAGDFPATASTEPTALISSSLAQCRIPGSGGQATVPTSGMVYISGVTEPRIYRLMAVYRKAASGDPNVAIRAVRLEAHFVPDLQPDIVANVEWLP